MGDRNRDMFLWGGFFLEFFNAFYEQCLNCIFTVHAVCTAHDYFILMTHTWRLSGKNQLSCGLVIKDCYH